MITSITKTQVADSRDTWCTFQPKLKKYFKNDLKKFLIFSHKRDFTKFPEMKLSSPKIKKFLIFSKKKSFSYISGHGTF